MVAPMMLQFLPSARSLTKPLTRLICPGRVSSNLTTARLHLWSRDESNGHGGWLDYNYCNFWISVYSASKATIINDVFGVMEEIGS